MKETKTQKILNALLEGRVINQLHHGREFKTTRLGGLIFNIRKGKSLEIESKDIEHEGIGKPPVEYYCTKESISKYWDKQYNGRKNK